MSFADFMEGFADGFIPAYNKRLDNQAAEDREVLRIRLQTAQEVSRERRNAEQAHRERRRQAQGIVDITGAGDEGSVYNILGVFNDPAAVTNMIIDGRFDFGPIQQSLSATESSNNPAAFRTNQDGREFGGRLQFGAARLKDYAQATGGSAISPRDFAALPADEQARIEAWHLSDINARIDREGLDQYIGQEVGGVPITREGIIAMAHLGGFSGAANTLRSGGRSNPSDELGTSLLNYAARHANAGAASGSVDAQMAESGLAGTPSAAPTSNMPDNLFTTAMGWNPAERERQIDAQFNRYTEAMGIDTTPAPAGGFASPPSGSQVRMRPPPVDLSAFPSIASADTLEKLQGVIAEADAKGLLNRRGADQWLSAVEARRDALTGRLASSYLSGVTNNDTALNARNRALADIENGVIPQESAESVLSAIDRTISDIQNANWSAPTTEAEARTRLRVAQATGDEVELQRLMPYIDALAPAGVSVTNVIVRPTDGSVGFTTPAIQGFNTTTGQIEYRTLDGRPIEADGNLVVPIDEDIRKAATAVQGDNQISVMYRNGTQAVADMSRYVVPMYELAQLIETTPEVATYASQLAVGIDSFLRDTRSMIGLLEQVSRERSLTPQEAEAVLRQNGLILEGESLEGIASSFEDSARSGVVENMADARRAYEAYILLGTFRTGGIEGQEGRAVSNRLFEELQGFMRTARNVDQLRDRVRIQIDGMAREVNQNQQAILNHPQVRGFMQEYGYNPVAFGTLEDVLANDPRLAEATEYFLSAPVRGANPQPATGQNDGAAGVLDQARDAIARGANRDAVIQRLIDNGIDPSGL